MEIYPFEDLTSNILKKVIQAWQENNKFSRRLFYGIFAVVPSSIVIGILTDSEVLSKNPWEIIAMILLSIGIILFITIIGIQLVNDEKEIKAKIKQKEDDLERNPEKSITAWELARMKLESYLSRNIKQVRWIFFWTILIMILGFIILGYGIFKVYESSENFKPSILVTITGLITEIISATFLVIYKATMNQAKNYVDVLERINAVGMSVQILETIDDNEIKLKNETKAKLASGLLAVYGQIKNN